MTISSILAAVKKEIDKNKNNTSSLKALVTQAYILSLQGPFSASVTGMSPEDFNQNMYLGEINQHSPQAELIKEIYQLFIEQEEQTDANRKIKAGDDWNKYVALMRFHSLLNVLNLGDPRVTKGPVSFSSAVFKNLADRTHLPSIIQLDKSAPSYYLHYHYNHYSYRGSNEWRFENEEYDLDIYTTSQDYLEALASWAKEKKKEIDTLMKALDTTPLAYAEIRRVKTKLMDTKGFCQAIENYTKKD